jgi:lipoprotein-releasing system ATP-binding protein
MSDLLLEARGVKRVLPGTVPVTLVQDIDLRVEAGDFLAITGPSGSGKSSLLYLLGLLDEPTEGEITLMGHETAGLSRSARARLRLSSLGFIFQFHFLLPEFTAMGNVLIPMRKLNALSEKEMHKRAEEILVGLGL